MDDENKLRLRDISLWADTFAISNIAIPFNLRSSELLLSAFIMELSVTGLINECERLGMMAALILIKKLAEKAV